MLCWLHRLMISHAADSDGELNRFTQQHVRQCAACRAFGEQCETLGRSLRSQAAHLQPLPKQAAEQISRPIAEPPPPSVTLSAKPKWAAAACLVVATLIGFAVVMRTNRSPEPPSVPTPTIGLTEAQLKTVWRRLAKHPLATELDNLTCETESGVRFLVACLDVSPVLEEPVPPR